MCSLAGNFTGLFGNTTALTSSSCSGQCPLGTYSSANGSVCLPCAVGSYNDGLGASACTLCPAGQFGNTTGLTSAACSGSCGAGKYSGAGAVQCGGCVAGQYAAGSGSVACVACPVGTYGSSANQTSSACSGACSPVAGRYCTAGLTASSGTLCPAGQYRATADNSTFCSPCPLGSFTSSTGSASCSGTCVASPGYYCGVGMSSATGAACPTGTYNTAGALPCLSCLAGVSAGGQGAWLWWYVFPPAHHAASATSEHFLRVVGTT